MILTREFQRRSGRVLAVQLLHDATPRLVAPRQLVEVADDVERQLGPGQCHADAVVLLEKADLVVEVAPHQRDEHDVVFLALEIVDGADADLA